MATNQRVLLAAILVLSAGAIGCDDDDVRADAAVPDAARPDAARPDATVPDATVPDATVPDATVADAAMARTFTVTLTPEAEVPPCAGGGAGATGTATVTINAAGTEVAVMNLVFSNLSGPLTGAHIHSGGADVAGPVVLDFGTEVTSPFSRTFTAADYPTPAPAGAPADFASFLDAMRAGQTYINLHTEACPPGEIRAQIQ